MDRKRSNYFVVVSCPDCTGIDFQGCFGGQLEELGPFFSARDAEDAAEEFVFDSNWEYEIVGDGPEED